MLIPDNTWQTVWRNAKPVSARRQVFYFLLKIFLIHKKNLDIYKSQCNFLQKRLFDDTCEAEKILHFLESRNFGQIIQLALAPILHSAILRLKDESEIFNAVIPNYDTVFDKLNSTCCRLSRESWTTNNLNIKVNSKNKWQALLSDVTNIEYSVVKCQSIIRKLFDETRDLSEDVSNLIRFK